MLVKHVIGYLPSLLIPALTSFAAIYCYTRLLTPHEYGYYALTLSVMTLLNAVFFYWLQVSLPRLMPQAIKEGTSTELRVTAYIAFLAVSLIIACGALMVIGLIPLRDLYRVGWLAVPLALIRSFLTLNQAFHRSALNFSRYNLIECGQAILGLIAGLLLIWFLRLGSQGAVLGMVLGMACMMTVDIGQWFSIRLAYFSREILREIIRFGLPLTLTYGLAFVVSTSDRFLIEYFRGAGEVGVYAAGYTLMDRITALTFMMVSLPSFPLTVHTLENQGYEAARKQTYDNGVVLLALALPVCAGLIMANHLLASVVIGSDFREGALRIMPWIAISALFNGLATHYFDHAFYLAKKPYLLFFTLGPAALLNLIMNLLLIPDYGYMGAVYSNLFSYTLLLMLSIGVGRHVFPIRFPWKQALRIVCAVAFMAAGISLISFTDNAFGLIAMGGLGILFYALGFVAFNVMDVRSRVLKSAR